ncbi:hypothetical protein Tco_1431405 [Tanacetum coccineum]
MMDDLTKISLTVKENGKPLVKANKPVPQFIKKVSNSSNCNNASSYANVVKASANTQARDKFLKHKGVLTWFSSLKPWHDDFMVDERLIWLEIEGDVTYAIRVRELCSWTPSFAADNSDTDDEGSMEIHDLEKENNFMGSIAESALNLDDMVNDHVNETNDQEHGPNIQEQVINTVESQGVACTHEKPLYSDPFGLGPLIDKKCGKEDVANCFVTLEYPPGYSPNSKRDKHS